MKANPLDRRLRAGAVAEFVGAFSLTLVGGGAIINGLDIAGIALAHGLILSVMVCAFMHISGAQFNPAISIALAATGKQPWGRGIVFITAQLIGAIAAAGILRFVYTPEAAEAGKLGATLGAFSAGDSADMLKLLALEAIGTFFLMATVLGSAVDQRGVGKGPHVGGFAIGLCLGANIFFLGQLTGGSLNPARSFGPALVGGYWSAHWAYWLAPIVGATLAAVMWKAMMEDRERV